MSSNFPFQQSDFNVDKVILQYVRTMWEMRKMWVGLGATGPGMFIDDLHRELMRIQHSLDALRTFVRESKDARLLVSLELDKGKLMDQSRNLNAAYDLEKQKYARVCDILQRLVEVFDSIGVKNVDTNKPEELVSRVCDCVANAVTIELGRVRSANSKKADDDRPAQPAAEGDAECDCA